MVIVGLATPSSDGKDFEIVVTYQYYCSIIIYYLTNGLGYVFRATMAGEWVVGLFDGVSSLVSAIILKL